MYRWLNHLGEYVCGLLGYRRRRVDDVFERAGGILKDGIEGGRGGKVRDEGEGDLVLPIGMGRNYGVRLALGADRGRDKIVSLCAVSGFVRYGLFH